MCGRFTLTATAREVEALLSVIDLEDFPPRYNIAPTQPILMVIAAQPRHPGSNLPERRALLVRWGLIPGWAKDPARLPLLFNIRGETAAEKAVSRAAMRHRRTLVPASGFYEWQKIGKERRPFLLRPRDGGVIAFAGLMETYADPNGSEIDTGAILTTAASPDIAPIHPRMPVVVQPRDWGRWLDCRGVEPAGVADILRGSPRDFFEAVPVSDLVNKVANSGPQVQTPVLGTEAQTRTEARADTGQLDLF
jgi:putative SOS response-associated peptidase YedK